MLTDLSGATGMPDVRSCEITAFFDRRVFASGSIADQDLDGMSKEYAIAKFRGN
jgi:hypothetical protein